MPTNEKYLEFQVTMWAEEGRCRARAESIAGMSKIAALPPIIDDLQKVELLRLRLEDSLRQDAILRRRILIRGVQSKPEKILKEFGQTIFDGLLGEKSPFSNLYSRTATIAGENPEYKGIKIVLNIEAPELAQLPWEYFYNIADQEWLGLNFKFPIIRFLVTNKAAQVKRINGTINVLGMIANPSENNSNNFLDTEAEREGINRAVKDLHEEGIINFTWVIGQTVKDLLDMINDRPWHIFHFIGHGGIPEASDEDDEDGESREGFIVLAGANGEEERVPASKLRQYLDGPWGLPQLVVLNSCEGARERPDILVGSAAAALIKAGVPAVVAMQFPVTNDAAVEFGAQFYASLVNQWSIERALTSSRRVIEATKSLEWGIPALYTRIRSGQLFSIDEAQHKSGAPVSPTKISTFPNFAGREEAREQFKKLFL